MKKKGIIIAAGAAAIVAAVLIVVFAARGGGNKASAMWLVRAEGTVSVTDGGGADVPVRSAEGLELRLGLYNGYAVGTRSESYGWINLDDTKLTKLDEDSAVKINRDGRALELVLDRGSLFFNVTKPLEDDETLEIRSSSMVMAVRGTCGWVRAVDDETFDVYIIEGKVRVTADTADSVVPAVEQVTAGETARLSIAGGTPSVTLGTFDASDVPEFVWDEARENEKIADRFAGIGIDTPEGPAGPDGGPVGPEDGPSGPDSPGPGGSDPLEGLPEGEFVSRVSKGDTSVEVRKIYEVTGTFPNVYFNLPVYEGPEAGIPAINAFFAQMARDFLNETANLASDGQDPQSFSFYYSATAWLPTDGVTTVNMSHRENDPDGDGAWSSQWHYVLDLNTGEQLRLTDVMDGTESRIRAALKDALASSVFAGDITAEGWENVDGVDLDEVDFTVESDGTAIVYFSGPFLGYDGSVMRMVRLPLSPRYGGEGLPETAPAQGPADPNVIASGVGWSLSAGGVLTLTPELELLNRPDWSETPWGEYRLQVTGLVIGEGITALGTGAFSYYYALKELSFPESMVSIDSQAFYSCTGLESLTLGNSIEYIGSSAFYGCDALTSVVIPRSVKKIDSQAFAMCASLREVTFLGSVEELNYTFANCSQLTAVNLPEGLKSMDVTFLGCASLTEIALPSTLTDLGSNALAGTGIRSLTVPEGVLTLGPRVFWNCAELTQLSLPSTLTQIDANSFFGIEASTTINFAGTREQWEALVSGGVALSDAVTVNCNG